MLKIFTFFATCKQFFGGKKKYCNKGKNRIFARFIFANNY